MKFPDAPKFADSTEPTLSDFTPGTVGWLIQKYIEEKDQPGARHMGISTRYTYRLLQRQQIARKQHGQLKPIDFIEYCKARKAGGVQPPTINQEMTYLSGVLKYAYEIWDMPETAIKAYRKAKPQLVRDQLIGKGQARKRRPSDEELARLRAYFDEQAARGKAKIPMRDIMDFQIASGRRISETCRLLWADIDTEKRVCLVRNLKNPKGKGFHDYFPLLGEAWDIVQRQPRKSDRIFPYSAKSVGASYTTAKNALGIENLHLHDSRRECISRLFEQGYNVPEVAKVSLHRNPTLLLGTYTSLKAEDLHRGPASKR